MDTVTSFPDILRAILPPDVPIYAQYTVTRTGKVGRVYLYIIEGATIRNITADVALATGMFDLRAPGMRLHGLAAGESPTKFLSEIISDVAFYGKHPVKVVRL